MRSGTYGEVAITQRVGSGHDVEVDVDVDGLASLEGEVAGSLRRGNFLGGQDLIRSGVPGSAAEAGAGPNFLHGAGKGSGDRHDGGSERRETHDGGSTTGGR